MEVTSPTRSSHLARDAPCQGPVVSREQADGNRQQRCVRMGVSRVDGGAGSNDARLQGKEVFGGEEGGGLHEARHGELGTAVRGGGWVIHEV